MVPAVHRTRRADVAAVGHKGKRESSPDGASTERPGGRRLL